MLGTESKEKPRQPLWYLPDGLHSDYWHEPRFYEMVTAADVLRCIEEGADIHAVDNVYGRTPLHLAAGYCKDPAVIESLVRAGAELEARAKYGTTPLHWTALSKAFPVVESLIRAGADIDVCDSHGRTPLHLDAMYDASPAVIEVHVKSGMDANARDKLGRTPLHYAAVYGKNPLVTEALVSAGADREVQSDEGKTPLDLAEKHSNAWEVVKALTTYERVETKPGSTKSSFQNFLNDTDREELACDPYDFIDELRGRKRGAR